MPSSSLTPEVIGDLHALFYLTNSCYFHNDSTIILTASSQAPMKAYTSIYRLSSDVGYPLQQNSLLLRIRLCFEVIRYKNFISSYEMCKDADTFSDSETLPDTATWTRRKRIDCRLHQPEIEQMTKTRYKQASRGQWYVSVSMNLSGLNSAASSPQWIAEDNIRNRGSLRRRLGASRFI